MKHQEGNFDNARGKSLYYQAWLPADEPKAVLLIVHGLAEHCGRYMNVVNHFAPRGYAIYGLDHIGHGKSEGTRVFVERFSDYTADLKMYFDSVQQWQPGKPVFLVGHSMGGLIAPLYLLEHQHELAGAVISAPAVKVPDNVSPVTISIGKLLSNILPKAGLMGLDANGISRDPQVVQAYVTDPLVYTGKFTTRLAAEMLTAMQRITAEAGAIRLPVLIVQGSDDKLVDPAGARMLYKKISSTDKTLQIYAGLYHEVFNEPQRDQVLADVEKWLETHLRGAESAT